METRSIAPTHTITTRFVGAGYDRTLTINVRLSGKHWVSEDGNKYRATDGTWTGDKWGRTSINLASLTPIAR